MLEPHEPRQKNELSRHILFLRRLRSTSSHLRTPQSLETTTRLHRATHDTYAFYVKPVTRQQRQSLGPTPPPEAFVRQLRALLPSLICRHWFVDPETRLHHATHDHRPQPFDPSVIVLVFLPPLHSLSMSGLLLCSRRDGKASSERKTIGLQSPIYDITTTETKGPRAEHSSSYRTEKGNTFTKNKII